MKAKHTPGPWEAVVNTVRTSMADDKHRGYLVAECPMLGTGHDYKADARLIAAAPDLLAACEMALAHIETEGNFIREQDVDFIKQAIAKAKGES